MCRATGDRVPSGNHGLHCLSSLCWVMPRIGPGNWMVVGWMDSSWCCVFWSCKALNDGQDFQGGQGLTLVPPGHPEAAFEAVVKVV